MSTKIHNGYKINSNDFQKVFNFILKFRDEAIEILKYQCYFRMAKNCSFFYDSISTNFELPLIQKMVDNRLEYLKDENKKEKTIFSLVSNQIEDYYQDGEKNHARHPPDDFTCQLALLPFENKFYILLFAEDKVLIEIWKEKDLVSEFMFWNNTDPPDELTEREWSERQRIWDGILDDQCISSIPSTGGLTMNYIPNFWTFCPGKFLYSQEERDEMIDIINNNIPSFEDRLKKISRKIAFNEEYKKIAEKLEKEKKNKEDFYNKAFYDTMELFDKNEKELVKEKSKQIKSELKKTLTFDDFNIKVKELLNKK